MYSYYSQALNEALFFSSSAIIAVFPFVALYLSGKEFTASRVFSTIAIIANLKLTFTKFFSQALTFGSELLVSIDRIQEFLSL